MSSEDPHGYLTRRDRPIPPTPAGEGAQLDGRVAYRRRVLYTRVECCNGQGVLVAHDSEGTCEVCKPPAPPEADGGKAERCPTCRQSLIGKNGILLELPSLADGAAEEAITDHEFVAGRVQHDPTDLHCKLCNEARSRHRKPPAPPTPAGEEALIDHEFEPYGSLDLCLGPGPNSLAPLGRHCYLPKARHTIQHEFETNEDASFNATPCDRPCPTCERACDVERSRHRKRPAPPEADGAAEGLRVEYEAGRQSGILEGRLYNEPHKQLSRAFDEAQASLADALLALTAIQSKILHEPNSDRCEYCNDCERSPYNVPPHDGDCLVPRLAALISRLSDRRCA